MAMTFDAPETLASDTTRLSEPGTFHLLITDAFEGKYPPRRDGESGTMMNGFCLTATVQAGQHSGKLCEFAFYHPKPGSESQFPKQKMFAAFVACDLVKPGDLQKKGLNIDLSQAAGTQVVAEVEINFDDSDTDKKYPKTNIKGCNIYHIDDPRSARVEKDIAAIEAIPSENRHDAAYFEPLTKRKVAPKQESKPDPDFSDL